MWRVELRKVAVNDFFRIFIKFVGVTGLRGFVPHVAVQAPNIKQRRVPCAQRHRLRPREVAHFISTLGLRPYGTAPKRPVVSGGEGAVPGLASYELCYMSPPFKVFKIAIGHQQTALRIAVALRDDEAG